MLHFHSCSQNIRENASRPSITHITVVFERLHGVQARLVALLALLPKGPWRSYFSSFNQQYKSHNCLAFVLGAECRVHYRAWPHLLLVQASIRVRVWVGTPPSGIPSFPVAVV